MNELLANWEALAWAGGVFLVAILVGLVLHLVFWRLLGRMALRTNTILDDSLVRHCRQPTRYIVPVIAVHFAMPLAGDVPVNIRAFAGNLLTVLLTLLVAWTLIRLTSVVEDVVVSWYDIDASDNFLARGIQTQFQIIKKIVIVVISVLGLAMVLMSLETFRQLGAGILASAGLAGLVIGLAAQRTLTNLLAGIQIALTQPIRLDDVLIVEGEWGRVEEVTLTYVVVRIWDLRRLILPISYFLEQPFQNWTRGSADILGTVFLYLDYTVPVDAIRTELRRIVGRSANWDGKVCGVVVTDSTVRGVEVRALVSAADASKAWDLRCEVREALITYLQRTHPQCLPRVRADIRSAPEASQPTS